MDGGPVVDAHHHVWRLDDLAWLAGPTLPRIFGPYDAIRRDYTIEELREDVEPAGVTRSVYVQANWPNERAYDEAAWVQAVSDRTGWPHAQVAFCDFADPQADDLLRSLSNLPTVRGVRQQLHWHENPQYRFAPHAAVMNDAEWRRGFARLQDHGFLFELQVFAGQMADAAALARTYPQTTLVLQHAGMLEDLSPAGRTAWREGLRRLADEPNVHVKLSGLGTFVHRIDPDLVREIVGETVAAFGASRCIYGSNFPIEKLWTDYKTLLAAYKSAIASMPAADQRAILYDNAVRLYRL